MKNDSSLELRHTFPSLRHGAVDVDKERKQIHSINNPCHLSN